MEKNIYFIAIIRFIIIALYLLTINKIMKARKMDPTIKFKFDFRSLFELMVVTGINLGIMVMPITNSTYTFLLIGGQVMIVLTYFHLRRIVIFGKKLAYLMEHPFKISDIRNYKYEKGKMTFVVKNVPLSIRFPLSDMNNVSERLSGKYYKK